MNIVTFKLKKAMLLRNMTNEVKELLVIQRCLNSLNPIEMELGIFGSWELTTATDILHQVISYTLILLVL